MIPKPLLTFHDVVIQGDAGIVLGPINWIIYRSERIWMKGFNPEQTKILTALLTGKSKPDSGYLEELKVVVTHSDAQFTAPHFHSRSINHFLKSKEAPEFVWLDGRRRSLYVLVDKLGLSPDCLRPALKLQSDEIIMKYRALRFIVSRADLLLGEELFSAGGSMVRESLQARWDDFPGALLAFCSKEELAGQAQNVAEVNSEGQILIKPFKIEDPPKP